MARPIIKRTKKGKYVRSKKGRKYYVSNKKSRKHGRRRHKR